MKYNTTLLFPNLTLILSVTFLLILLSLHFIEPEFDPSWRMISEYALGSYGWLMQFAFFSWGGSVLFLLVALWPQLPGRSGQLARWWLVIITLALFGAGIFTTNSITEPATTAAHTIHALCGAIVIITFPFASALTVYSLGQNAEWAVTSRKQLRGIELTVWLSLFLFFGSLLVSRAINPAAGRVGPEVFIGWPNRFLVVVYHLWLMVVAWQAKTVNKNVQ